MYENIPSGPDSDPERYELTGRQLEIAVAYEELVDTALRNAPVESVKIDERGGARVQFELNFEQERIDVEVCSEPVIIGDIQKIRRVVEVRSLNSVDQRYVFGSTSSYGDHGPVLGTHMQQPKRNIFGVAKPKGVYAEVESMGKIGALEELFRQARLLDSPE